MKRSSSNLFLAARVAWLLWLIPAAGHGLTYVKVADETLVDRAEVIVEVQVLESDPSPGIGRPVTDYLMAVESVIRGDAVASPLTVRTPGGVLRGGPGLEIYGAPRFAAGERALLFLKPDADGTYHILHLAQGAFHLLEHGGKTLAWRDFAGTEEVSMAGRPSPRDGLRDLERFRAWLEDRAHGVERTGDYFVAAGEDLAAAALKFSILTHGGRNIRWRVFDTSGNVKFKAHQDGQPGLAGGGFGQFQTGLAVWTNDSSTPIDYRYDGTTSRTGGLTSFDNVNTILFDDPNDNPEFDRSFNCATGGTIAIGGPWFDPDDLHLHNGENFVTAIGGDIVTNKNVGCVLSEGRTAEEVFAHELGHTLGLGHSASSGALMFGSAHGGSFGATLTSDDRAGIQFLYGAPVTSPAAPSGLTATAVSNTGIDLSWNDNSSNEQSFDLERQTGGGSFQRIARPAANSTSYQDASAQSGTTYSYRLRALNGAGASGYSNTATASTPGEVAPSDLSAFGVSDSRIRLFWTDHSSQETGFEIQAKSGGAPFTLIRTVPAGTETADVEGLAAVTTYTFRVRSVGAAGASGYSNEASARTFYSDPEPCVPGPRALCLNDGRFKVEVSWRDYVAQTGSGTDAGLASTDSGLFYFFTANNWELLVKVLDACGSNSRHFWVFAAATTDVAYELVVTDSRSGFSKTYSNQLGVASPAVTDTSAFPTCFAEVPVASPLVADVPPAAHFDGKSSCLPSDRRLCLNGGRYAVEVEWHDFAGNAGFGRVDPLQSSDSGLMWFFNPENVEVLVKVLNGCPLNGRVWVFAAATTNVEYTLRVNDTATGATKEYFNPLGLAAAAVTDTQAFACAP